MRRYAPIVEALALLLITLLAAVGLHLPTLWLVSPLVLLTLTRRSYDAYGLSLHDPGSVRFHIAVIAAVFVPYVFGHYALARWWFGAQFHLRLPPRLLRSAFEQVLMIGLPEEFFFRGYLQTQLDRVWQRPYRLLGTRWGLGLPAAAALFAVCHVIYGGPVRLIVVFPGLLYGWLRARAGTIAVPALYHAASNVLMEVMQASLTR